MEETQRSAVERAFLEAIATEGPFRGPSALDDLIEALGDLAGDMTIGVLKGTVYDLAHAGLVDTSQTNNLDFVAIEASTKGYAYLGMPPRPVNGQVGTKGLPALHPGDPTDFRNHGSRAEGGEITRLTPAEATKARFGGDGSHMAESVEHTSPETAWEAVVALSHGDGVPIVEVARRLNLSPSPATIRLRKAEALGWVTSVHSGTGYRLYLTPDAKDKLKEDGMKVRKQAKKEKQVAVPGTSTDKGDGWVRPEFRAVSRGGEPRAMPDPFRVAAHERVYSNGATETVEPLDKEVTLLAGMLADKGGYPAIAELLARTSEALDIIERLDRLGMAAQAASVRDAMGAGLSALEYDVVRYFREKGVDLG